MQSVESAQGGVAGEVKNLIFAANGPKPEIVLRDALNNDVEITKNGEHCLTYDRPIPNGLTWRELVAWWAESHPRETEREVGLDLHRRLRSSIDVLESPGEVLIFDCYARLYGTHGFALPVLIPQVYLPFDPRTQRSSRDPLVRQRMDFLLLLPNRKRIVIELDGQQHYSEGDPPAPSPRRYAEMVSEDRKLRLDGYEVFRFGGYETRSEDTARLLVTEFFVALLNVNGYQLKAA